MARKVAFRKKKNNRMGMACVSLVVVAVFVVIMVRGVELREKMDNYEAQTRALEKQIQEQEERRVELEEYEKYTKTDKYVEEIAKEKLGLVYEDEILFKSDIQE